MHGAGAALALVAALLGTGQAEMLAQCIQQCDARLEPQGMDALVDLKLDTDGGIAHEHSASGCAQAAAGTAQQRPHRAARGSRDLVDTETVRSASRARPKSGRAQSHGLKGLCQVTVRRQSGYKRRRLRLL